MEVPLIAFFYKESGTANLAVPLTEALVLPFEQTATPKPTPYIFITRYAYIHTHTNKHIP